MSVVPVCARIRLIVAGTLGLALIGGVLVAAGVSSGAAAPPPPAPPPPRPAHVASLAPAGAVRSLTANQVLRAATACAGHAAAAGWANNGVYGGNLVTAVAVCVAESGGQPKIFHCDATGAVGFYPPVSCASGSYDRGLWQLNSQYQTATADSCAFSAQCNANAAYRISGSGISFSPWAVYNAGSYARYLDDAQAAVSALTKGAVASGVFGVCLASAHPSAGAAAVVGRCSHNTGPQQWMAAAAGTLTQGGRCLTAGQPGLTLAACTGAASQTWRPYGLGQLRNAQTGTCLNDPGSSTRVGKRLTAARCTRRLRETWWLP
jgi:lysozyme-like protein/ricin-type beta-trefoil lectin protein